MSCIQTYFKPLIPGAIAAGAGVVSVFGQDYVRGICKSSTSELRDYLCLKSSAFFDPQKLATYVNPLARLKDSMACALNHFIPRISSHYAETCTHLFSLYENLHKLEETFPIEQLKLIFSEWKVTYLKIAEECCKVKSSAEVQAHAFAEEIIFRLGIQKIGLVALSRLFPNRIGKVLSHQITRILITSFLFAFAHPNNEFVISQFLAGVVTGLVFEKYGIIASSITHSIHNHLLYSRFSNHCDSSIFALAQKQSELVNIFQKVVASAFEKIQQLSK